MMKVHADLASAMILPSLKSLGHLQSIGRILLEEEV